MDIKRNNDGEVIRIQKTNYQGKDYIDVRVWYLKPGTTEYAPTRKGINFTTEQWLQFQDAVEKGTVLS